MEQRKLISMCDYILEINRDKITSFKFTTDLVWNYANFLKQTPNIGMFVPAKEVDGVWVVLEEPKEKIQMLDFDLSLYFDYDVIEMEEYQEAKSNVIFEGFEVCDRMDITEPSDNQFCIIDTTNDEHHLWSIIKDKTIEDLVKYNLTLTEETAKKLGL